MFLLLRTPLYSDILHIRDPTYNSFCGTLNINPRIFLFFQVQENLSFRRDSAKIESDDHVASKDQLEEKDQPEAKDIEISEDLLLKKVKEILEESMEQDGNFFVSYLMLSFLSPTPLLLVDGSPNDHHCLPLTNLECLLPEPGLRSLSIPLEYQMCAPRTMISKTEQTLMALLCRCSCITLSKIFVITFV